MSSIIVHATQGEKKKWPYHREVPYLFKITEQRVRLEKCAGTHRT